MMVRTKGGGKQMKLDKQVCRAQVVQNLVEFEPCYWGGAQQGCARGQQYKERHIEA